MQCDVITGLQSNDVTVGRALIKCIWAAGHWLDGQTVAVVWSVDLHPAHRGVAPQFVARFTVGDPDTPCGRSDGSVSFHGVSGIEGALSDRETVQRVDAIHLAHLHW